MATQLRIIPPPPREVGRLVPEYVLANRPAIEDEVERLIEAQEYAAAERYLILLDAADGDCDIEDDDQGGDGLEVGELNDKYEDGIETIRPIYGVDQSEGPINEPEMIAAHALAQRRGEYRNFEASVSARFAKLAEGGER